MERRATARMVSWAWALVVGCGTTDGGSSSDTRAGSETGASESQGSDSGTQGPLEASGGSGSEDPHGGSDDDGGSGDSATGASSSTGPELPPGQCYDGDHDGIYPCECSEGETQPCEGRDGIEVCIIDDHEVYTASYWSACLECEPGTSQPCTTADDEAGLQFCNVATVEELDPRFGASWGECLPEAEIACDPIRGSGCTRGEQCRVDDAGVPACGP
jgi:hypothetical protein